MERIKIAICMEKGEYLRRLSGCLMNHYRRSMEIHIFTDVTQLAGTKVEEYAVYLIGDFDSKMPELRELPGDKVLYLTDSEEDGKADGEFGYKISKYEEVPRIVDLMGVLAGKKELTLDSREITSGREMYGVYSLSASHLQLPFIMTLGDILSEKKKVLVVDLQENSGLAGEEEPGSGMEDVMAMAKTQKYTRSRLISAIGHMGQWDYIYPVRNSECLCEGDLELYQALLQMMEDEMNYDAIIINFGTRFQGFFQLMWECKECFLLAEKDKRGWREQAFYEELEKRKTYDIANKLISIETPVMLGFDVLPQRVSQQWIWNEPGDAIRNILNGEKYRG